MPKKRVKITQNTPKTQNRPRPSGCSPVTCVTGRVQHDGSFIIIVAIIHAGATHRPFSRYNPEVAPGARALLWPHGAAPARLDLRAGAVRPAAVAVSAAGRRSPPPQPEIHRVDPESGSTLRLLHGFQVILLGQVLVTLWILLLPHSSVCDSWGTPNEAAEHPAWG